MIVTIDDNKTCYEFGKNCKVKVYRFEHDYWDDEDYLFEYGFKNEIFPKFSVWHHELPDYYQMMVKAAYQYVGFDNRFTERDIKGLLQSLWRYVKKQRSYEKNK